MMGGDSINALNLSMSPGTPVASRVAKIPKKIRILVAFGMFESSVFICYFPLFTISEHEHIQHQTLVRFATSPAAGNGSACSRLLILHDSRSEFFGLAGTLADYALAPFSAGRQLRPKSEHFVRRASGTKVHQVLVSATP